MSADKRKLLNKQLYNTSRLIGAPPVLQRELPKQTADSGYHTGGYSISEIGAIDETRLQARYSSEVPTIEPAERMSDGPDINRMSLIEPHTSNKIIPISSLLPQHSSSSSSAYNPFSDQPPAAIIAQSPPNPLTGQRITAEYLAKQRAQIISLPPMRPDKRGRKTRTCAKCQSEKCPGNANRKWCKSVCFDCGQKSCRGRNTKQPRRTCKEATWDD
jgi:hypothetical protein